MGEKSFHDSGAVVYHRLTFIILGNRRNGQASETARFVCIPKICRFCGVDFIGFYLKRFKIGVDTETYFKFILNVGKLQYVSTACRISHDLKAMSPAVRHMSFQQIFGVKTVEDTEKLCHCKNFVRQQDDPNL